MAALRHVTALQLTIVDEQHRAAVRDRAATTLRALRVLRLEHLHVNATNAAHLTAALEAAAHIDTLCTLRVINNNSDRDTQSGPAPLERLSGLPRAALELPQRLRRLVLREVVSVGKQDLARIGQDLVRLTHLYVLGCAVQCDHAAAAVAGVQNRQWCQPCTPAVP